MQSPIKTRKNARRAFTLIELLVVVLILGVLLAIAIPLYLSSVKTSATQGVKANMRTIANAGQAYYVKNSSYPADITVITNGAGKDIEGTVVGPRGVTYAAAPNGSNQFVVTATENGDDAFNTTATNESATFNLTTGAFSGL